MNERMTEIRYGRLDKPGEGEVKVEVIDSGENYDDEKGSTPNHDRIEIVYISPKS
jgi:hypothetical protein